MVPVSPSDGCDHPPGRSGGSPVILLLGDEPLNSRLVTRFLGSAGFETCGAVDRGAVRRHLEQQAPVLVIRDLPHDRRDDPELVDLVDRSGVGAPIVYLTGDALADHCDGEGRPVIAKPFTAERLLAAVRWALRARDGGPWRPPPETHVPQALLRGLVSRPS
jgi:DNA-binding response OmpR family regulator